MSSQNNQLTPLERYGHNLTRLATLGTFTPLTGYEEVKSRVFQVFQRKSKNSPLILAADENRRRAAVVEVIRSMAIGDAPTPLRSWQVIELDYEALFANLSDDASIREDRINQAFSSARKTGCTWTRRAMYGISTSTELPFYVTSFPKTT